MAILQELVTGVVGWWVVDSYLGVLHLSENIDAPMLICKFTCLIIIIGEFFILNNDCAKFLYMLRWHLR